MVIRSVSNEDEGIYLVKAKNESGEIEHSFRLTIDGKLKFNHYV
jgi:hypothetical protein